MPDDHDAIVEIPPNRVRFFGRTGHMLLPCPATVAKTLKRIARSTLITTDTLRQELARQFGVEAVCPVTTRKALQSLARDGNDSSNWWRVLRKTGEVLAGFPEGGAAQIRLLGAAGYKLDRSGKTSRVMEAAAHFSNSTKG